MVNNLQPNSPDPQTKSRDIPGNPEVAAGYTAEDLLEAPVHPPDPAAPGHAEFQPKPGRLAKPPILSRVLTGIGIGLIIISILAMILLQTLSAITLGIVGLAILLIGILIKFKP